ncbi:MAG: AmmeMemoRadiSam system protein A [Atribacterota bacterium]
MNKKRTESTPVKLARKSIVFYLKTSRIMKQPEHLSAELTQNQAGVFVSLKKDGNLRGCIGTFLPTQDNIALEIIENAVSAATRDPRFPPVTMEEVDFLSISVDILSPPEEVDDICLLDPRKYGVIVSSGFKKGLLLPNLEGVNSAEYQIEIAKRKAGIFPGEKIQLSRFEVKRYY